MAGDQKIGGVNFQEGMVKNSSTEQKTRKNQNGQVEAYTEYSVWLKDGTKLEYTKEQNGASVFEGKGATTVFSGFNGGSITDTENWDRYILEGCQGMYVEASRREDRFIIGTRPADEDTIQVKDKINPDGTIVESKNNSFKLNEDDEIQLQDDYAPRTMDKDVYSLEQKNLRNADKMKDRLGSDN